MVTICHQQINDGQPVNDHTYTQISEYVDRRLTLSTTFLGTSGFGVFRDRYYL
jgi:hypothetical protein